MANTVDLKSFNWSTNRSLLREQLIKVFLKETPGVGKGTLTSRYDYKVALLSSGMVVFLKRPAQFNNGFDFTINVLGIDFNANCISKKTGKKAKSTMRPSHNHILSDLREKKKESILEYNKLLIEIANLYNCKAPSTTVFNFKKGYTCDLLLSCIYWLFVEQDVTYWNYSGRAMFYDAILKL